jgi:hypothetical protein
VLLEPRNRAPLGVKTNNQKARAPQTPAPFGGALKPGNTNRRASTVRKKTGPVLQQSQTKVFTEAPQDDVPDIEYMPPKPKGKTWIFRVELAEKRAYTDKLSRSPGPSRRYHIRHNLPSVPTKEPRTRTGKCVRQTTSRPRWPHPKATEIPRGLTEMR